MNKKTVFTTIKYSNYELGYFELLAVYDPIITSDTEFNERLLQDLKTSGFFFRSTFINERDVDRNLRRQVRILTAPSETYGPYYFSKFQLPDFIELSDKQFLLRMEEAIKGQIDCQLTNPFFLINQENYAHNLITTINDNIAQGTIFYELNVAEFRNEVMHEFESTRWDYFKGFVGLNSNRKFLYRITLARD